MKKNIFLKEKVMWKILLLLLMLSNATIFANMASPYREGTRCSNAFSSKDIDIINEKIRIKIIDKFLNASYFIDYNIRADKGGLQIPLLFLAKDFTNNFRIWVDNKEIIVRDIPSDYKFGSNPDLKTFSEIFNHSNDNIRSEFVRISFDSISIDEFQLKELKYFEVSLTKGMHIIHVEYNAEPWTSNGEWIKEFALRYSLSPAKFWRSFGNLEIEIVNHSNVLYTPNIGVPNQGKIDSVAVWKFNQLPSDFIYLLYNLKSAKSC